MQLLEFVRIVATSVSAVTREVRENLAGHAGDSTVDDGEKSVNQPAFGALHLISRVRAATKDGAAEGIARRTGDALIAFARRDMRLNKFFPSPKEGAFALVGYAGAFDSNEPTFDGAGAPSSSVRTIYVPFSFVNGAPTKAHAIVVDGTSTPPAISIVHAEGMAITIASGGKNSVVVKNKAGDAYIEVNDDGLILNGNTVINGGATIGSPAGALPAAKATPLIAYLTALETLLSTIAGATTPSTSAAVVAFVAAQAAGKAAIAATKASVA